MSIDKTIKIGVDSGSASQEVNKIRKEIVDGNKENIEGLKENIRLLRERDKEEELSARKKIRNLQEIIRLSERELQIFKLDRESESLRLQGSKKREFDERTKVREIGIRGEILRDKSELYGARSQASEEKERRALEIKRAEAGLSPEKGKGFLESAVTEGVTSTVMKSLGSTGVLVAGVVAAAVAGVKIAEANEKSVRSYSQNMRENPDISLARVLGRVLGSRDLEIASLITGKTGKEFIEQDYSRYQRAYGSSSLRGGMRVGLGLAAAERVTGLSGQQIEQVLTLSRYSGQSSSGQISAMENYLMKTEQSLVRLPEIMTSYLSVANSIFQKTGIADPIAVQRMMQSVGGSYGVQGANLDRMTSTIQKLTGGTGNDILTAMQLQAVRRSYPKASYLETLKILQNPEKYKEYQSNLLDIVSGVGGGGVASIMNLRGMLGTGTPIQDLEKIVQNKFRITEPSALGEDYYEKEGLKTVGAYEKTKATAGEVTQGLTTGAAGAYTSAWGGVGAFIHALSGPEELNDFYKKMQEAIERGFTKGVEKNAHKLSR